MEGGFDVFIFEDEIGDGHIITGERDVHFLRHAGAGDLLEKAVAFVGAFDGHAQAIVGAAEWQERASVIHGEMPQPVLPVGAAEHPRPERRRDPEHAANGLPTRPILRQHPEGILMGIWENRGGFEFFAGGQPAPHRGVAIIERDHAQRCLVGNIHFQTEGLFRFILRAQVGVVSAGNAQRRDARAAADHRVRQVVNSLPAEFVDGHGGGGRFRHILLEASMCRLGNLAGRIDFMHYNRDRERRALHFPRERAEAVVHELVVPVGIDGQTLEML